MNNFKKNIKQNSDLSEAKKTLFQNRTGVTSSKIESILNLGKKNKDLQFVELKEYYPLSPNQKRLYILYQTNKKSLAYNVPKKYYLGKQANKKLIENVFQKLIERHECLRTSIIEINNEPVQKIHKNVSIKVVENQIEQEYLEKTFEDFAKPYDLSSAPAMRVSLLDVKNDSYYLFVDIHHLFCDFYSFKILFSEFIELARGKTLAPIVYNYKDYCQWQFLQLRGTRFEKQENFWIQKFNKSLPELNLPIDFSRPRFQSSEGAQVNFVIDDKLTEQIRILARTNNFTLPMVLFGTYSLLLSKISNQDELIIGMPLTGRSKLEFAPLIGLFVNTLPIRLKVDNQITIIDFLAYIKYNMVQAIENRDYQFEDIVAKVHKERDLSHHPIFDVLFNFITVNDTVIQPDNNHSRIRTKFDLSFLVTDNAEKLILTFEYCTKLFKPDTIDRFMYNYKEVLEQITANLNNKVKDIGLISNKDKHRILNDFNNTRLNYPKEKTIHELFEGQVNKNPENIALITKTKQFTYNELNVKANRLAKKLRQKNIKSNSLVGIMVDRTPEMLISILSVLKSGNAYLPIDPEYPQERIKYMILDSETRFVLSQEKYINQLASLNLKTEFINVYTPELSDNIGDKNLININTANDLAYVIYTSGSTGKPKGVMLEHRNINNFISGITSQIPLEKNKNILCLTTISFDIFVLETLLPLTNGYTVVLADEIEQKSPEDLQKLIIDKNVDLIQITPSRLRLLMYFDKELKIFSNVNKLLIGGEALHEELFKNLKKKYHNKIYNMYGPTETSVWSSIKNLTEREKVTIGKPIANTQIYILDNNNLLCPIGIPGELCIGGDGLARGYLNREELTNDRFIPFHFDNHENSKLYKTGDLAKWLPDGDIEYIERIDHQVKIRGFRIELGEIESAIVRIKGIMEAVVVAKDDINGDKRLVAYIVARDEVSNEEIKTGLAKSIPEYMVPSVYIRLKKIPLTPNGKINMKALPVSEYEPGNLYIAPSDNIEKLLAGIWESILGLEKVGVLDNFLSNGGDSIKAIAVSSGMLIKGYNVNVQDILKYQTIKELVTRVSIAEKKSDQSTITGKIALTPIQRMFFGRKHVDEHYYNQSVMLNFDTVIKPETITSVFGKLVEHHDALRMIFYTHKNKINQENIGLDYPFSLKVHTFSNEEELNEKLKIANEIQSEINLVNGPLIKLVLFQFKQTSELLVVIHQLLIDTVSWRIIFEDLSTLFKQHDQKNSYHLPPKTDSFKLWSEALHNYVSSDKFEKEKQFWQNRLNTKDCFIKKDFENGSNTYDDILTENFSLSETLTKTVLTDVHRAYGTQINDVLLAALQLALEKTFGVTSSKIELEGHGRGEIGGDVNINRTVGWFTSIYPVMLESGDSVLETLIKVKEMLRSIPNIGIGYGMNKYLLNDGNEINSDKDEKTAISFNYLGQLDVDKDNTIFKISGKDIGENISLNNRRAYELDISAFAVEKCLRITIDYSQAQYKRSTIQKLISNYELFLEEIISGCQNQKDRVLTPSDLTFKDLPIEYLNELQKELSIQDIYPLSPMQEGMFFHYLVNKDSLAFFNQFNYRIKGTVDWRALKKATEYLLDRYDILRAQFFHGQYKKPLQIILKSRDADFSYIDLRSKINDKNKKEIVEQYRIKDRKRKFDLLKDVLMRVILLQLSENEYELFFCFHHILIDGWCKNILLEDFVVAYNAFMKNNIPELPPVKQYVEYIKWIQERDNLETEEYWEKYLQGYNEQTIFPSVNFQTKLNKTNNKHEVEYSKINKEKTLIIKGLANEYKITLNTIIQTVWGILLSKYANRKDVVFGSVVSGRPSEIIGIEKMVGLFINTVPVRVKYEDSTTFKELLMMFQESNIQSTLHHYYPLVEIQNKSLLGKELLNHVLAFENMPVVSNNKNNDKESEHKNDDELKIHVNKVFQQSNYDLDVVIMPHEEISIEFTYNSNVFSSNQIKNLISHLDLIIDQIIEQPEKKVIDIDILSEQDKLRIIYEFNNQD